MTCSWVAVRWFSSACRLAISLCTALNSSAFAPSTARPCPSRRSESALRTPTTTDVLSTPLTRTNSRVLLRGETVNEYEPVDVAVVRRTVTKSVEGRL